MVAASTGLSLVTDLFRSSVMRQPACRTVAGALPCFHASVRNQGSRAALERIGGSNELLARIDWLQITPPTTWRRIRSSRRNGARLMLG